MQLPVFLPDSPSVQGRAGQTESCISAPERDRDRGSNLALCGWWFIRNAVLYDGDLIGRKACAQCAEKYAAVDYRPSRYPTPEKLNWSWKDILLYQDPGWQHNWLLTVLVSFIGTFGLMQIYMPYSVSKAYFLFFGMGGIGILTMLGMFYPRAARADAAEVSDDPSDPDPCGSGYVLCIL